MLGAAKWLLENEGPVLKRLLAENSVCAYYETLELLYHSVLRRF